MGRVQVIRVRAKAFKTSVILSLTAIYKGGILILSLPHMDLFEHGAWVSPIPNGFERCLFPSFDGANLRPDASFATNTSMGSFENSPFHGC
jgi:hypothetical protein